MQAKDDLGNNPESDLEGYELKNDHVKSDLRRFNADIPVLFFNSASDDAGELTDKFVKLVHRLRQKHVERIQLATAAIEQLQKNYKVVKATAVRKQVITSLEVFIAQHSQLAARVNPAHHLLVSMVSNMHPSTVWATTRRQGWWYNFDVYHTIGAGA